MKMQPRSILFILSFFIALPLVSFCQTNDTIVDSHYTWTELQKKFISYYTDSAESKLHNYQKQYAVQLINEKLALVNVSYISYDNRIHNGQIICHKAIADDVKNIFKELLRMQFPICQCKPISEFAFADLKSMQANNTSVFDYRLKTGSRTMSKHSYGLAIDINPVENPYKKGTEILPDNNNEKNSTGRIRATEQQGRDVIALFQKYGWMWGGNWHSLKDYMHFEKN